MVSANAPADGLVLLFVHRDANLIFNVLAEGHRRDLAFVRADKLRCDMSRPPHPCLNVRDDREAPLVAKQDGESETYFL